VFEGGIIGNGEGGGVSDTNREGGWGRLVGVLGLKVM